MLHHSRVCLTFLTLMFLACLPSAHAAPENPPEIVKAVNDVAVRAAESEDWVPTEEGRLLNTDDQVKTGQESRAEVDTHPGTIRLYQNALLTIPELGIGKREQGVSLTRGAGIFHLAPMGGEKRYRVTTNQVSMVVKGTTFSVILEGKELYEQEVTRAIRSFTAMDISGAVVAERWVDPADGTVYSLMKLDSALVEEHLEALGLSKPSKIYVRKAFSDAQFKLE